MQAASGRRSALELSAKFWKDQDQNNLGAIDLKRAPHVNYGIDAIIDCYLIAVDFLGLNDTHQQRRYGSLSTTKL